MSLDKLWVLLEHEPKKIKLKEAFKRANIEWYSGDEWDEEFYDWFFKTTRRYQTEAFVSKAKLVSKISDIKLLEELARDNDLYHLYLLRKTRHRLISMTFGRNSALSVVPWEKIMAVRKQYDVVKT